MDYEAYYDLYRHVNTKHKRIRNAYEIGYLVENEIYDYHLIEFLNTKPLDLALRFLRWCCEEYVPDCAMNKLDDSYELMLEEGQEDCFDFDRESVEEFYINPVDIDRVQATYSDITPTEVVRVNGYTEYVLSGVCREKDIVNYEVL